MNRRIRVITTQGRSARVTPGRLDRHARRAFALGNCLTLAIALARETGWPIFALRGYETDRPFLAHAFVQSPYGWLVDIDGIHGHDITREWKFDTDLVEITPDDAEAILSCPLDFPPQYPELARTFVDPVLKLVHQQREALAFSW